MNKLELNRFISFVTGIILIFLLLFTFSFAWFANSSTTVDASRMGGKLLTNYFHCGTGTEEDPFVITRPIHYYNLVHLYQKVSDYSENSYYFEVGYKLKESSGDNDYYVYNYDNDGNFIKNDEYAKVLNLACYSDTNPLLPIGTHDKNFLGHFNGHGLTISNFTVSTKAEYDCDLGIFGYVGVKTEEDNTIKQATITNVFFDNVTIDLSNIRSTNEAINLNDDKQTHNASVHTINDVNKAYVGSIAGHVITNAQITDVYVNDIKFVGGGSSSLATSHFGYFGCIEDESGNLVKSLKDNIVTEDTAGTDFNEVYDRLTSFISVPPSSTPIIYKSKTVWKDRNDQETILESVTIDSLREYDPNDNSSSFSFSVDEENDGSTIYLTGEHTFDYNETLIKVEQNNDGFLLQNKESAATKYIKLNNDKTDFETCDTAGEATIFAFDDANRLFYSFVDEVNHVEAVYYYISMTGITTDPNQAISGWNYNNATNQLSATIDSKTYYLAFSGDSLGGEAGGSTEPIIQYKVGGTTYYVTVSGTTVGYTTDKNSATIFEQDANGFWKVAGGGSSSYISYSNSKLVIGATQRTAMVLNNCWYFGDLLIYLDTSTSTYSWKTKVDNSITEIYLFRPESPNNYFLNPSLNASVNAKGDKDKVAVPQGAITWTVPANSQNGLIYYTSGSTNYYLCTDGPVGGAEEASLYLSTDSSNATQWNRNNNYISTVEKFDYNNGRTVKKTNYYLSFTVANGWYVSAKQGKATIQKTLPLNSGGGSSGDGNKISESPGTIFRTLNQEYLTTEITESVKTGYILRDTYFPLLVNSEEDKTPANNNYGYVVSGMSYFTNDFKQSGDVRVESLLKTSIPSSITKYEFDGNDFSITNSDKNTVTNFNALLEDKTFISAIRLMNKNLDISDEVVIPGAKLNSKVYIDLSIPRSCIYLNLETNTSVKLIYYTGNDTTNGFFTLYKITRNETGEITSLTEVCEYGNTTSIANKLYYFEIPVEQGEYCVGSYNGNNDPSSVTARLLYLDVNPEPTVLASDSPLEQYGLQVDVRRNDYNYNSSYYVDYSLLQYELIVPNVSSDLFSINVSFTPFTNNSNYPDGLYTFNIVNHSTMDVHLTVFLCDNDDNINNEFPYAYNIIVNNNELVVDGDNYFKSCKTYIIESD